MTNRIAPPTFAISSVECARDHAPVEACRFQIAWAINPYMQEGSVDHDLAAQQHRALREALVRESAILIDLPFVHGAYDSVFAKDPAVLVECGGRRRALLARPRFPERRVEQAPRAESYARAGFEVRDDAPAIWEGGDVVVLPSGVALLGYGVRSELQATDWLEANLSTEVFPLELCDPYLFHLDMALTVLPNGTVLFCEEAFSPRTLRALRRCAAIEELVAVPRECALSFGLNMVPVGGTIIMGTHVPAVERILRARGFRPLVVPLGEFHRAGGGAACLTTRLHTRVAVETSSGMFYDEPSAA